MVGCSNSNHRLFNLGIFQYNRAEQHKSGKTSGALPKECSGVSSHGNLSSQGTPLPAAAPACPTFCLFEGHTYQFIRRKLLRDELPAEEGLAAVTINLFLPHSFWMDGY
jgi:hypothetical protein